MTSPHNMAVAQERRFFLILALTMAAVIIAGFSTNLIMGRSSFDRPIVYHIHAVVFFAWLFLYVGQSVLVDRGSIQLHRRLGWLALGMLPLMLALGLAIVIVTVRRGVQFFFDVQQFYISNVLLLLLFVGLMIVALILRRNRPWHIRLVATATALLTEPGFGRLLPIPLLMPWSWYASLLPIFLFPIAGAIFDLRWFGKVHPAWLLGMAAIIATQALSDLVAYSDIGISITRDTVAGTRGGERPLTAYTPSKAP